MSSDPNENLGRGQIVRLNDCHPEVKAKLPSGTFPLQDADIGNMSASKLLGGAANQFIRWIAGTATWVTLAAADIIAILGFTPENIANKNQNNGYAGLDGAAHINASALTSGLIIGALGYTPPNPANYNTANNPTALNANGDLAIPAGNDILMVQGILTTAVKGFIRIPTCAGTPTGIPTNGNGSVVYDNTNNLLYVYNGGWISVGGGSGGVSEVQFLQQKSDAGKLIIVSGSTSTVSTSIVSYTPANGATFVFYKGRVEPNGTAASYASGNFACQLRNNAVVRDTRGYELLSSTHSIALTPISQLEWDLTKGDTLVGNGVKTYDIFLSIQNVTGAISATLEGYLE